MDDDALGPELGRIVEAARRPVEPDPAAKARLMEAVRAANRPGVLRRAADWLLRPRPVRVSPLGALAAAAVVALLALPVGGLIQRTASSGDSARAVDRTPGERVQFVFVAPGARAVSLVGDFNDWNPAATPLRATGRGGVWTVEVPLSAGRYTYSFVVDGAVWHGDPAAPPAPEDDFGRPSSVLLVAGARS